MKIELNEVVFAYPRSDFSLSVPGLAVRSGGRAAVVGPSGSGKTTLLNLMAGVLVPDAGRVSLGEDAVSSMGDRNRRRLRLRRIGFVFQSVNLLDYLNVRDNILLPYRINRGLTLDAAARGRAAELAASVGLGGKLDRSVDALSQGERQRVGVCRALVHRPAVVLADEPTSSLDEATARPTVEAMFELVQKQGCTLVMLTHDRSLLGRFEQVITVSDGIATSGPTKAEQGASPYFTDSGGV